MHRRSRPLLLFLLVTAAVVVVPLLFVRLTRSPSNERQWHAAQRVLPRVTVSGDTVRIRNVRDFTYWSESSFEERYVDRTFDLQKLDSVSYGVSRFGGVPGLAHAFLTFGFGDDYVSVSVEARKESAETYSPVRGLFREYELMYVIGTERDIIGLRTEIWLEDVSLYPVKAGREAMRRTFLDILTRAERLAVSPEFYNTLTNSCSSNIVRHVNAISPGHVRAGLRTVLPGYSDRLAFERGLIDSDLSLAAARERFRVRRIGGRGPIGDDYSTAIRRDFPRGR